MKNKLQTQQRKLSQRRKNRVKDAIGFGRRPARITMFPKARLTNITSLLACEALAE